MITKQQMRHYRKVQKVCQKLIRIDKERKIYMDELTELLKEYKSLSSPSKPLKKSK